MNLPGLTFCSEWTITIFSIVLIDMQLNGHFDVQRSPLAFGKFRFAVVRAKSADYNCHPRL
jgi:hypothetical protein